MEEENEIKELFAQYGKVIFIAQCIEKGLIGLIINTSEKITKSRYNELLFEKSQLTFGQLKRELHDKNIFTTTELNKFDTFHTIRDELVHSFWWNRAVEFSKPNLRSSILKELENIELQFDSLNSLVDNKARKDLEKKKIDVNTIEDNLLKSDKTPSIEVFRKLNKNETVLNIQSYNLSPSSIIPVFTFEDGTFWILCESGLSQYKEQISLDKLNEIPHFKGLFPIKQFNPRPNKTDDWNYNLDLKKLGLIMKIRPVSIENAISFKWIVSKK